MDIDAVLSNPAFSGISTEQRDAYKKLSGKIVNKNISEAVPIILEFMANAPKGKKLSDEEQSAMLEAVAASLGEADRAKFKALQAFVRR